MAWPWPREEHEDRPIRDLLDHLETQQEQLMATVQQLTDGLAQTNADLQTLIAAGVGGIPETALDPVLQAVTDLDNAIKAAIPAPPA